MQRVDTPYRLRHDAPKVAVLIDNGTASSGEAVLIAFQRRPDTRTFGNATCGLSTANQEYMLSDGASLFHRSDDGRSNEVPLWSPDHAPTRSSRTRGR